MVRSRAAERPALVYLRQPPRGLGASQNLAFRSASASVVAVTDDDCVPAPDWLEVYARLFAGEDAPEGAAGRVLPLDPEGDRIYPVSSRISETPRDFHGRDLPWHVGSGNNFAVQRDWFLRIGGCDERLGPGSPAQGGVDMDLFYRLLRAGARLRYEPAALVRHERETAEGRRGRRPMYGRGMGAAVTLRLRERDWYALRLLGSWVAMRTARFAAAAVRRDLRGMGEEWLMLRGTAAGLLHGATAPTAATHPDAEAR